MANPDPSPGTRFRPGCQPGPGRPRGSLSLTELLRHALESRRLLGEKMPHRRTVAEQLVEQMIRHAMEGRGAYMKEIMDRNDGPIVVGTPGDDIDEILDEADRLAAGHNGTAGGPPGPLAR